MICHNSVGYDAQIKDLLIKSAFNMDKKEIDAWIKYQYDPQHMFCFWQDDKITSCLQVTKRTMMFLDRQMRVSVIGMAATLPDYRQRKQFSNLLDAAISQATYNDLLTITYTNMPKLFEAKSFQHISNTQEYWIGEEPFFDKNKLGEIKNNGVKLNAICTHTCPDFCAPYTKDGIKGWLLEDSKLEKDIDKERQTMTDLYNKLIEDGHPIDKWCYGHYHFHDFQEIDGIKFYLLDMDRNGVMDFVEIYRNDNEINENIIP